MTVKNTMNLVLALVVGTILYVMASGYVSVIDDMFSSFNTNMNR